MVKREYEKDNIYIDIPDREMLINNKNSQIQEIKNSQQSNYEII